MKTIIEFLGWLTVVSFGLAILNFFVKYVNKKYISKLPKDKKNFVDMYRKFMRILIKYHKLFGLVAIVSSISHFALNYYFNGIKITGLIALGIMIFIGGLGIYGAYINKKYTGTWLKIHRIAAFTLIVSIIIHVI
ncbi:hypothetical protein [Clostridium algidicarnis]|uniref:hypothetical protein n=1 Tax=Clostridium algidicarnis TaxID=37659 RepID=UPI001A9B068E|nr:hypothetical protein [Clostridium algidicarnis]